MDQKAFNLAKLSSRPMSTMSRLCLFNSFCTYDASQCALQFTFFSGADGAGGGQAS